MIEKKIGKKFIFKQWILAFIIMQIAALALGISLFAAPQKQKKDACQIQWEHWKKDYVGGSPFSSSNKTSPIHLLSTSLIERVFKNNPKAWEEIANIPNGWNYKSPEQFLDMLAFRSADDRFKSIEDNLDSLIKTIKKENQANKGSQKTLLIVYAGESHSLLHFLSNPSDPVMYASYRTEEFFKVRTENFHAFEKTCHIEPIEHKMREWERRRKDDPDIQKRYEGMEQALSTIRTLTMDPPVAPLVQESYWELYDYLIKHPQQKIPVERILSDYPNRSNIIFISNYHGIRNTSVTDELPSEPCLQELGYSSVVVAMEGMNHGALYDYDTLYLKWGDPQTHHQGGKNCAQASDFFSRGDVYLYPDTVALLRKAKSYADQGTKVRYYGLE